MADMARMCVCVCVCVEKRVTYLDAAGFANVLAGLRGLVTA